MGNKIYNRDINERITVYLRSREWFIHEALDYHDDWDDRNERALRFRNATWRPDLPGPMVFAFVCSKQLDPKAAPDTEWVAETVADAKASLPEVFATISQVELYCGRSHDWLEML